MQRLRTAFRLTNEDHSDLFERFANAFLLTDYPELEGIGAKKDKGMDARLVAEPGGQNELVVQSCVSPADRARAKVLGTIEKLKNNLPHTLVYCTPSPIGLKLDETKRELRRDHRVNLEVCDEIWFVERSAAPEARRNAAESYCRAVLDPLLPEVTADRLYSEVLSNSEERQVARFLEAHRSDHAAGKNLTHALFESLIIYVLRDTDSQTSRLSKAQIIEAICAMFPDGHHMRINQLVPSQLNRLVQTKTVHHHTKEDEYVLAYDYRKRSQDLLNEAANREIWFRSRLRHAVFTSIECNEIDYDVDADALAKMGHHILVWYMQRQAHQLQDPTTVLNVLNTEELVSRYFDEVNPDDTSRQTALDVLPTALLETLTSDAEEVHTYLRNKSDVFVAQAFLQSTPDVQRAFRKLFGGDIIYVDTTILIQCTIETYEKKSRQYLCKTLNTARTLGISIRTFRPFVEEFVAHLRGPVLLEWINHFMGKPNAIASAHLQVAPQLIGVFCAAADGRVAACVEEIVGVDNHFKNAAEFLHEEFGIVTEDIPPTGSDAEHSEWETIFGHWLDAKHKKPDMTQDRFELLVRNDVNSYCGIRRLRKTVRVMGDDYGRKIWLLTMDRMYWRIPHLIGCATDRDYYVAIGREYLVGFLATLAEMEGKNDVLALPSTLIMEDAGFIPSELRALVADELDRTDEKRYLRVRRVRDLVYDAKTRQEHTEELFLSPSDDDSE